VEARTEPADPKTTAVKYLGGWFCELGHPDDKTE
jgi:uronate dehydrogenase